MIALMLVMVASIAAVPHLISDVLVNKSDRFVSDLILNTLEQLKEDFVSVGFDPYYLEYAFGYYAIPVPVIFSARGLITEVNATGLSNFEIRHVDYEHNRLEFDLFIPRLEASCKHAEGSIILFGSEVKSIAKGSLVFKDVRLAGELRVSILGGVSITQMNLDSSITTIQSALEIVIVDYNITDRMNKFLEVTVAQTLEEFKGPINELISYYLIDYINNALLNS